MLCESRDRLSKQSSLRRDTCCYPRTTEPHPTAKAGRHAPKRKPSAEQPRVCTRYVGPNKCLKVCQALEATQHCTHVGHHVGNCTHVGTIRNCTHVRTYQDLHVRWARAPPNLFQRRAGGSSSGRCHVPRKIVPPPAPIPNRITPSSSRHPQPTCAQ